MKKFFSFIFTLILIVSLSVFIISFSIGLPIYIRDFYFSYAELTDIPSRSGYSMEVIHEAFNELMDYLVLNKEFSTGILKYSEEGKSHFVDVKFLFDLNFYGLVISLVSIIFISAILTQAQIRFIPLKGAVIRKLYPETWMRTSCDIDILIEKQSFDFACSVLKKNGYKEEGRTSHDISFVSPSNTHIELHFDLIEDEKLNACSNVLARAWDYAKPIEENSFHCVFSNEFFCFYHLAHMAKHFLTGGCGVRSFLDYYILRRFYQLNEGFVELLEQAQLLEFEKQVYALTKCWFENESFDETTNEMHEYILLGGVLGDVDNMVAMQSAKVGEKKKYLRSRLFVSYSVLSKTYPVLQKHKWLTPFYQIKRWLRFLFRGGFKKSNKELTASKNISQENLTQKDRLLTQLRLK